MYFEKLLIVLTRTMGIGRLTTSSLPHVFHCISRLNFWGGLQLRLSSIQTIVHLDCWGYHQLVRGFLTTHMLIHWIIVNHVHTNFSYDGVIQYLGHPRSCSPHIILLCLFHTNLCGLNATPYYELVGSFAYLVYRKSKTSIQECVDYFHWSLSGRSRRRKLLKHKLLSLNEHTWYH